MITVVVCIFVYLAGSVNFSILASKLSTKNDIRKYFSGNPGAANVYRMLGPGWAAVVLTLDLVRGFTVAWTAMSIFEQQTFYFMLVCLCLLIGNIAPIFHGFKGGKGVATSLGIYLAMNPIATLIIGAVWFGMVALKNKASLGSLAAITTFPLLTVLLDAQGSQTAFGIVVLLIIAFTHRTNIANLLKKKESLLRD